MFNVTFSFYEQLIMCMFCILTGGDNKAGDCSRRLESGCRKWCGAFCIRLQYYKRWCKYLQNEIWWISV